MVTDLQPGMLVSRYRLEERIAQGGMGSVWSARDTRLERSVAIKMLPRILVTDPSAERRFEREARAMGRLQHPNVVSIYDVGAADPGSGEELPFLVMELIRGRSLDQLLKDGPLPPLRAAKILEQVGRALGAAHHAGIIHRDLKPSNVMVSEDDHVKVLDFGLARLIHQDGHTPEDTLTTPGMVLGSCPYMAPEQALGQQVIPASDIFSCGAVLYECLAGRRAFDGATPMRVLQAVVRCEYEPLVEVAPLAPPVLARLVDRCLRKDPAERFRDGGELARTLYSLVESGELARTEPASAVPSEAGGENDGRGAPWRRWAVAAGLVVAGAVTTALVAGLVVLPRMEERVPRPGSWSVEEILVEADLGHPSWSPTRGELVVERTQKNRGEVVVVAAEGGAPRLLLRGRDGEFLRSPRYSPDGKALAVVAERAGEAPRVRILSSLGGTAFAEIEAARDPGWLDGDRLLFVRPDGTGSQLWLYGLGDGSETTLLDRGAGGPWWRAEPRPGGGAAVLAAAGAGNAEVQVFAAGRWRDPERWAIPSGSVDGLSWSPSGRSLAVSAEGALARLDGDGFMELLPRLEQVSEVRLSPDGRRLAGLRREMTTDLISVDPAGRGWSCLACGWDGAGLGSALGGVVVLARETGDGSRIALLADGVHERWLTEPGRRARAPVLAPGAERLAFVDVSEVEAALKVIPVEGGSEVTLATAVAADARPSWSPAGDRLVVAGADGAAAIVDLDGSSSALPWRGVSRPVWSPDGRTIAFVVTGDEARRGVWIGPADGQEAPIQVGVDAEPVVWSGDGRLVQLRWDGAWLDLWEAAPPTWAWSRRVRVGVGAPPAGGAEVVPLAFDPASGRLIALRQVRRTGLLVFSGLDPERW